MFREKIRTCPGQLAQALFVLEDMEDAAGRTPESLQTLGLQLCHEARELRPLNASNLCPFVES